METAWPAWETTDGFCGAPVVVNAMGCRARYLEGGRIGSTRPDPPGARTDPCAARGGPPRPFVIRSIPPARTLVPRSDGRLLVGATVEEAGFRDEVTVGGVMQLFRGARSNWRQD